MTVEKKNFIWKIMMRMFLRAPGSVESSDFEAKKQMEIKATQSQLSWNVHVQSIWFVMVQRHDSSHLTLFARYFLLSHLSHLWFHKLFYLVFAPFFKFCHSVKVTISRIFIIHLSFKSSVYEFHLIISINIWFVCTFTFPSSAFPSSKHAQIKNIKNKK